MTPWWSASRSRGLVGAAGVAASTARDLDVGEGQAAPEDIGDVPGSTEVFDRIGVVILGLVELAASPVRQSDQRRGAAVTKVIGRIGRGSCSSGMGDRGVRVAGEQSESGTVDGDLGREPCELVVIKHDDRFATSVFQLVFDALDERGHAGGVTGRHARSDERHAEHGPVGEGLGGKRFEPSLQRGLLSSSPQAGEGELDQARGPLEVVPAQRMLDGLSGLAVCLIPVAGSPMQLGDEARLLVEQVGLEHIGEEVVVPVPTTLVVERDEKEVRPVERLQHGLAA